MKELYCFELYKGYTIVVEYDDPMYEGIVFKHSPQNPESYCYGDTGEEALHKLMAWIDAMGDDDNETSD